MPREILGLKVHTDERVYRPSEDSILLGKTLQAPEEGLALDLCTGTGIAAMKLAEQGARTIATDLDPHACRLTRRNAAENGRRVDVVRTDLAAAIDARFDAIACNPPYLPTGPEDSGVSTGRDVDGGRDGAELSRDVLDALPDLLTPEGRAWLVVSSLQPVEELEERAAERGLTWTIVDEIGVGRFEKLGIVELGHRSPEDR